MIDSKSDVKIIGFDVDRPPVVRKEAYIDLFFQLSRKVSMEWCEDFNQLGSHMEPPVKIDKNERVFVETWVRDMHLIPAHLEKIKKTIIRCNKELVEKIRQQKILQASKNAVLTGKGGEQNRLNKIIDELSFDN